MKDATRSQSVSARLGWLTKLVGLFRNTRGASLVEYMIVAGFISLAAIAAFQRFGSTLHRGLTEEQKHIRGEGSPGASDLLASIGGLQDACAVAGVCPIGQSKCFAGGTLVATESGDRPIESIQVGDKVWSRNPETGVTELKPVLHRFITANQPVLELELHSGFLGQSENVRVTPGHRFWAEGRGWVHAEELTATQLFSPSDLISGEVLSRDAGNTTVYNLEVDDFHTYFVGHAHALVHNADPNKPDDCNAANAAQFAKLQELLKATQAANGLVDSLRGTGGLPPDYITKDQARANGWEEGKALNNTNPGKHIGGDVFNNSPPVEGLPTGHVWHEADIGDDPTKKRKNSPGWRLLYSEDGLLYITTDHYGTAEPIGRWK